MLVALGILAVTAIGLLWYWFQYRWLVEPEGAPPLVKIDGSAFKAMQQYVNDPDAFLRWAKKTYGDVFTLYMGFFKMTVFTELTAVDWIQRAPETELSFSMTAQKFLAAVVGWDAVETCPLEEMNEKLDKIGKCLTACMPHFFDVIKYETERWAEELVKEGKPVDWMHAVDVLVMRINVRCFMGSDGPEGTPEKFVPLYDELETKGVSPSAMMVPDWWPWGNRARCRAIRKELDSVIRPMVQRRKQDLEKYGPKPEDCCCMDDYITNPHDATTTEPWSEDEIVERVNTVKTMFWTSLSSTARPAVTKKLTELLSDMEITYNEVKGKRVRYIEHVLKEAVRPMYPINIAVRGLERSTRWKDYVIPKGYFVAGCSHLLNSDPNIFPEPDSFLPERWESTELNKKMWRFFGAGQHRCRGEKYALLITKTAMAVLFKDYQLIWVDQKRPDQVPEFVPNVALPAPIKPVMMLLKRKDAGQAL